MRHMIYSGAFCWAIRASEDSAPSLKLKWYESCFGVWFLIIHCFPIMRQIHLWAVSYLQLSEPWRFIILMRFCHVHSRTNVVLQVFFFVFFLFTQLHQSALSQWLCTIYHKDINGIRHFHKTRCCFMVAIKVGEWRRCQTKTASNSDWTVHSDGGEHQSWLPRAFLPRIPAWLMMRFCLSFRSSGNIVDAA